MWMQFNVMPTSKELESDAPPNSTARNYPSEQIQKFIGQNIMRPLNIFLFLVMGAITCNWRSSPLVTADTRPYQSM